MKYLFAGILLQVSVLSVSVTLAADAGLKAVFVKNGEIYTLEGDHAQQLTNDGVAKFLPVWSKDGKSIAFAQFTDPQVATGTLKIVDEHGDVVATVLIAPHDSEIKYMLRGIESIEWLSDKKIAISGTTNPSTTENQIIDVSSGYVLQNFYDDGYGASYSADGRHFAYVQGAPHFASRNAWEPNLAIDNKRIYPPRGVRVNFLSAPQWSPQGSSLGIIAENVESKERALVIWRPHEALRTETLAGADISSLSLCWHGEDIVATTAESNVPTCPAGTVSFQGLGAVNIPRLQTKTEAELRAAIAHSGGTQASLWCESCAISPLPAKADVNSTDSTTTN